MLDRERLTVYPRILLALYTLGIAGWWLLGDGTYDRAGKPIGGDFVAFQSAAQLSITGKAADVWNVGLLHAQQVAILGPEVERFPFHYPPPALLAVAPLAPLPYGGALAAWLILGLLLFAGACWLWVRDRQDPWPWIVAALACPAVLQNTIHGQTGALTAALMGGGLALVPRSPWIGGVLLGLLLYKPQYLPLVGIALLLTRRWRAMVGLVAGASAAAGSSWLLFGGSAWWAFVDNIPLATRILLEGGVNHAKMPSAAAAMLLLGVPGSVVQPAAMILGLACAATVVVVAWRRPPFLALVAVLVLATLLSTPFLFEYDLVVLTVAIGACALDATRRGWWPGEKWVLLALYLLPAFSTPIASLTGLQLGPMVLLVGLVFAVRRAWSTPTASAP